MIAWFIWKLFIFSILFIIIIIIIITYFSIIYIILYYFELAFLFLLYLFLLLLVVYVTFHPPFSKKAPSNKSLGFAQTLFSFWDSLVLPREREVLLSQRAHTSFSLCASALFSKRRSGAASLILHASIAEITAQLLSLSYVYLISSDDN